MRDKGCSTFVNWNNVIISLVVVTVFTIAMLYAPDVCVVDGNILKSVREFLAPYPTYIPLFFSEFGDYFAHLMWPQITLCAVLLSNRKYLQTFLFLFFFNTMFSTVGLLKNFVCRERPCGDAYPGFSFPSGHASQSMCLLGIAIYLVIKYVNNKYWRYFLVSVFGLYIFMVCVSRMWLAHHYPFDVLAGLFLGFMFVNLFIIADKFFEK